MESNFTDNIYITSVTESTHSRYGSMPVYEIMARCDTKEYVFVLLRKSNEVSENFLGLYKCELWGNVSNSPKPKMVGYVYLGRSELHSTAVFLLALDKLYDEWVNF